MEELYRKYQGKTIKDDYGKNSKEFIDFANESLNEKVNSTFYLDFMRDLILFSEIYNLIFFVYNAFIRHKQHSFLHDKRTSGNSVQD